MGKFKLFKHKYQATSIIQHNTFTLKFYCKKNTHYKHSRIFNFVINYVLSSKLKYTAELLAIEKHSVLVFLDILYYSIFIYFFIQFIINFKKIDSSSNLQHLLKTIITTRKSVHYYILSSLISLNLNTIIFFGIYLNTYHQLHLKTNESNSNLHPNNMVYCCILMLFLVIISFLIWHIYKIINLKLLKKQKLIFKELNN